MIRNSIACAVMLVLLASTATAQVGPGSIRYQLLKDGQVLGVFAKCDGLGSETEVIEQKIITSGGQEQIKKLPGRLRFTPVVCERSLEESLALWEWRAQVENGEPSSDYEANLSITILNDSDDTVASWDIEHGWPSSIHASIGDTGQVEEIVIQSGRTLRVN